MKVMAVSIRQHLLKIINNLAVYLKMTIFAKNIPMAKEKKSFNSIMAGFIPGLIVPVIAAYLFYLAQNSAMRFSEFSHFIVYIFKYHLASKVMSVALVANLAVFFLFLQTNRYKSSRGVIAATLLYALATLIYMLT